MSRILPRRRFLGFVSVLPFLVVISLGAAPQTHVVIMHTNDIHGHLLPDGVTGGSARIASIVREMRPNLMLDAGDLFTGTPIADLSGGRSTIEVMNAIGYDAVALGNHEFDYGIDVLRQRMAQANFQFLSANVGGPLEDLHDGAIFSSAGIQFGVVGLSTEELKTTTHPRNLGLIEVRDIVESLEETISRMWDRVDFLIVLGHLTPAEEIRVAQAFPEIGLIIGGHSHQELTEPIFVGETMIVRTGHYGQWIGRIDIEFQGTLARNMTYRLIPTVEADPDAEVADILAPYEAALSAEFSMVVAHAPERLQSSDFEESPLANLIADAVRAQGGTQIALTNLGGIRAGFGPGPITRGKLFEVLPFQNTLVTMKLSGRNLKSLLAHDLLAVSGLRIEVDMGRPAGDRLVSVALSDGTSVEDGALYSVTANDFLLAGGDGFVEFAAGTEIEDTGMLLREALEAYIAGSEAVPMPLDGRVRVRR